MQKSPFIITPCKDMISSMPSFGCWLCLAVKWIYLIDMFADEHSTSTACPRDGYFSGVCFTSLGADDGHSGYCLGEYAHSIQTLQTFAFISLLPICASCCKPLGQTESEVWKRGEVIGCLHVRLYTENALRPCNDCPSIHPSIYPEAPCGGTL